MKAEVSTSDLESGECGVAHRLAKLADGFVIALAILINPMDRRAGNDVVKLIEKEQLPCAIKRGAVRFGMRLAEARHVINGACRVCRRFLSSGRKRQGDRIEKLGIVKQELGFPISAFVFCLARVGAAVELEVELAHPDGQIFGVGLGFLEELDGLLLLELGQAVEIARAASLFEHLNAGTAASVAPPIDEERSGGAIEFLEVLDILEQFSRAGVRIVSVGRREVSEDARPVDAFPEKGMVGELVELAPRNFLSEKVFDAALAHDLRQGSRIAKDVRNPDVLCLVAEFLLEIALAVQDLPNERFAGGQDCNRSPPTSSRRAPIGRGAPLF